MEQIVKQLQEKCKKRFQEDIPMEVLEEIIGYATPRSYKKGEIILQIGEKLEKVYVILKGIARSYYLDSDGNDVTKFFLEDLCASESFVTQCESEQCIEALEDMETLVLDAKELKAYILQDQLLTMMYINELEKSLIYKMSRENSFLTKSATERYIDLKKEHPRLEERVAQKDIASYLGITPVSLSRIRRTIREEN